MLLRKISNRQRAMQFQIRKMNLNQSRRGRLSRRGNAKLNTRDLKKASDHPTKDHFRLDLKSFVEKMCLGKGKDSLNQDLETAVKIIILGSPILVRKIGILKEITATMIDRTTVLMVDRTTVSMMDRTIASMNYGTVSSMTTRTTASVSLNSKIRCLTQVDFFQILS